MGRDDRSQEKSGKKKRYTPPRFAHLTPEQARAVPVAKELHDGPVVKQLLEWIAELAVISTLEEKDSYDVGGAKSDGHGGAESSCQKQSAETMKAVTPEGPLHHC